MTNLLGNTKTLGLIISYIVSKIIRRRTLPAILMYHSFDDVGWRYGVDENDLEKQIDYIKKHRTIVSLKEIIAYAKGDISIPDNTVAITVDDGYKDTYEVFFKIAKKYDVPFTIFLTTDLAERSNLGNLPRPNWDELREISNSRLSSIGLHGHTHVHFTEVVKQDLYEEEIEQSLLQLKNQLGIFPHIAAYPSGRYNSAVIECLENRGKFEAACATHSGFIRRGDDLFTLKRVEVTRKISFLMFKLRLTPALDVYNKFIFKLKKYV